MELNNLNMKKLSRLYIYLVCALLFLSYPFALFIPYGHGYNIFDFVLPSMLILSLAGLALLIINKSYSQSNIFRLSIIFAFISILSGIFNQSASSFYLHSAGYALIPLGLCLALSKKDKGDILPWAIGLLWLVNMIHAYSPINTINEMGLSGNKNWFS